MIATTEYDFDYHAEIQELLAHWGDKYVKWLKLDEPGTYPFVAVDEPDLVDIKGKAVMRVPVAHDQQMRYIGFGESASPMSCYVGLLAIGYYNEGISGLHFHVVVEDEGDQIDKSIPEAEPYVNRLIQDSTALSTDQITELLNPG